MAVGVSGAALASPIGTVSSEGTFLVRADGLSESAQFRDTEYTFFSGDTLRAQDLAAILNLDSGGGLGLPTGAEVTVTRSDDGRYRIDLNAGAVLYAFPPSQQGFEFRAGNFVLTGVDPEARMLQVGSGTEFVGQLELLDEGNIKATVRSGELFVRNGSQRYQISAGETIGLLDLSPTTLRTQSGAVPADVDILIQSPERVGTNDRFQVRWEASQAVRGDYVAIAKSGAKPDEFVTVVSSDEGELIEFTAPSTPGDYEIRFIDGETGAVREFVYLDVIQEIPVAYWWDSGIIGPIWGVAAGAVAIYILDESRDGPEQPVSP